LARAAAAQANADRERRVGHARSLTASRKFFYSPAVGRRSDRNLSFRSEPLVPIFYSATGGGGRCEYEGHDVFGIVSSSYTGGPVQQILDVMKYGTRGTVIFGNLILWKTFRPPSKIFSARYYAYVFTHEDIRLWKKFAAYPNKEWAEADNQAFGGPSWFVGIIIFA